MFVTNDAFYAKQHEKLTNVDAPSNTMNSSAQNR